jgi:hypothetical protein
VKELFAEYLVNCPPPSCLYLVTFVFGKDQVWASSNCSIETVCASAMVIYTHVLSGKYRF